MAIPDSIANVLGPHLGALTADAVARHLCAKYGVNEQAGADQRTQLREVLRRGLVAYVGTDDAARLSEECIERAFPLQP